MPVWKRRPHRDVRPESAADLLCPELMADPMVDHDGLTELLRDPSPLAMVTSLSPRPPRSYYDEQVPRQRADPVEPVGEESVVARLAKLAALGMAMAMLSGAVVAAALIAQAEQGTTPGRGAAAARGSTMTGVRALIGFDATGDPAHRPAGTVTGEHRAPDVTRAPATTDGAADSSSAPPSATIGGAPPRTRAATVEAFYRLVDQKPGEAIGMLSPQLLDSNPDELVRIWDSVREITLHEVRPEPDGMVRVVLTMVRAGERPVRMTQLLGLATPNGPITEVKLLSSQRTSATTTANGG